MRVVFGLGLDGGAWPGPLGDARVRGRTAAFDEAWVGPLGLLKILETSLGLVGPDETAAERAAALVPALRAREGRWSRSLDADPLAVARAVLRVRDALVDAGLPCGAAPASLGPRLEEILLVTQGARAGTCDRFAAVARALEEGSVPDVERLTLVDRREALSPLLAAVVALLEGRGVVVEPLRLEPVVAGGDLGASRGAFPPGGAAGDGTLQLVRADTPEETAIEVAAHLSLLPDLDDVVVIGADAVLDGGLVRMGLPATGARGARGDDGLLQLAPLVVALAWPERDPARAFELLSLGVSPVPRRVGGPLARSLVKVPAVGSDAWQEALTRALEGAKDDDERQDMLRRLARFIGPPASLPANEGLDLIPLADVEQRLDALRKWLFGRAARDGDERRYAGALGQVAAIGRIARGLGAPALGRVDLMRVVEQATAQARARTPREPLAGIARVADPAAVCGPVGHVVWWGFTDESEPPPRLLSVSREERAALAQLGVSLPSPAAVAEERALAWQRPLLCARSSLVLGCPRRNAAGDEVHSHPMWDEIVARAGGTRGASPLERKRIVDAGRVGHKQYRAREAPRPQRDWCFPAGHVARPDPESPSAREVLLGCSFRAVVERSGVREREHRLREGSQLFGEVAHDVIAEVLRSANGMPLSADEALHRARVVFDARVPVRAATWLRASQKSHCSRSRETIARAAARLAEILSERGLMVKAVEVDIVKGPEGRRVKGRPDLVVGDPLAVIDLKSGGDRDKQAALQDGTAVQLVAYAQLVKEAGGPWPGIAYFQVRTRKLLTTSPELGGAQAIETPYDVEAVSLRLKRAGKEADDEVARGRASAPGVGVRSSALRSFVDGEQIVIASPCRFCAFSFLCGRALDERTVGRDR